MSHVRNHVALLVLFAAALVAAPGVLAASPQDIYSDYADNGQLDATYTQAELEAALTNAVVQGYGSDKGSGLKPEVEEQISEGSSGGTPSPPPSSAGLPFTGLDLGLIAAGAAGLLLLGMGLRRVARQRP